MSGLPPDAWVPVDLRARYVRVGDLIAGNERAVWFVTSVAPTGSACRIVARRGADEVVHDADPDEPVPVLIPADERDAVELARGQLGARLAGRALA